MEKSAELEVPRSSLSKGEVEMGSSAPTLRENEGDNVGETIAPAGGNQTTDSTTGPSEVGAENTEYVTGYKLILLLFSVTTFFFLLMLDMSIISTVSGFLRGVGGDRIYVTAVSGLGVISRQGG